MTDLIERVDAAFSETAGDAPPQAARSEPPGRCRRHDPAAAHPLGRALGGSAVLLFAMSSGHLHGARATAGIVAALVQVALAVGALTRPSRVLFGAAAAGNVAIAVFWVAVEGPQAVSAATAGIGVALSGIAVLVAAALALRPTLGSAWSSATSVIGSIVPVAVAAVAIAGLFLTTTAVATPTASTTRPRRAARPPRSALSGTVKVPGENSKTFQSIVAGNATEQSELQKWVPLDAHDQAILTNQLYAALQAASATRRWRPPRRPT